MANKVDEISRLAAFLQGLAAAAVMKENATLEQKLSDAAKWLEHLSRNICGEGIIGCFGGRDCDSDHK